MATQGSNATTLTFSKERFRIITNEEYIPIKLAGKGQHGVVWYAIPTPGVASTDQFRPQHGEGGSRNDSGGNTEVSASTVKESFKVQLCAVKVSVRSRYEECANEVSILNNLQKAPENLRPNFLQVLSAKSIEQPPNPLNGPGYVPKPECLYFTMRAVNPSITLSDLYETAQLLEVPIPRPLIAHITLQLCDTFRWMQEDLEQPIAHSDLAHVNIMLDLAHIHENGLPNVILIDFATATQGSVIFLDYDRACLFYLMHKLAILNQPSALPLNSDIVMKSCIQDESWNEFTDRLARPYNSKPGPTLCFDEFNKQFRKVLIEKIANIRVEEKWIIGKLLDTGTGGVSAVSEEEIQSAISEQMSLPLS
jgi:serine/threonine protein kinase